MSRRSPKSRLGGLTSTPNTSHRSRASMTMSAKEIGHNSLSAVNPELQDTGMVEMYNQCIPSELGNQIAELPQSPLTAIHSTANEASISVTVKEAHELSSTSSTRTFQKTNVENSPPKIQSWPVESQYATKAIESPRRSTRTRSKTDVHVPISKFNASNLSTTRRSRDTISRNASPNHQFKSQISSIETSSPQSPASHIPRKIFSRRLSLQSTYADVFDYDSYTSRHGTPAVEDAMGKT